MIDMSIVSISPWAPPLGLHMTVFSLRLHVVFALHLGFLGVSAGLISSSFKDIRQTELGLTLLASSYLNHLVKSLIARYSYFLRFWVSLVGNTVGLITRSVYSSLE